MKTCKCNREELDIVVQPNIILKIEECGTSNSNLENSIILELHKKQDKEDEGLITTSKNVVGAINEIKQKALDDYGPYENTALEEIATMLYDRLTPGKTIGVIEDDKVVEYWWQPNEEAGVEEALVYHDDTAGVEFSYNFIREIENIDETPLYEWKDDSGAKVYTKTKNSTSDENGVYRLVDGALYFIASIDRIIQTNVYAFVKKAGGAIIEQNIKTNVACGALPAGSTIDAGKTFTEVIRLLTSKVLLASRQTSPSATITSTIATNTTKEVGETIAPTLTATFNDGEFNYYAAGAITTETIDAGCTATAYQILRGTTVISSSSTYTDSYKLTSGNTTYTCEITHSASASGIPTNSDGSVNTDVQYPSNTVTSNSITIKGAYKYFYGSADSLPDNVRALTNGFSRPSSVEMTGTKWFLYVQKSYKQPTSFKTALETYTIENETTSNQDKKGVILKKEVTVKDAGGSDVAYYRYMMQLDNALGSNINIA